MGVEIEKPLPMQIGDRYLYTLSSYEPVEVEVTVPYITDLDVDMAIEGIIAQAGGTKEDINDQWIAEKLNGVESVEQLKEEIYAQLKDMQSHFVEEEKQTEAVSKLAGRLQQQVPAGDIAVMRNNLQNAFEQQLKRDGITKEQFEQTLDNSGDFMDMVLGSQAKQICEQGAALDAYVSEKKIEIEDSEIPAMLGMPGEAGAEVLEQARKAGDFDYLKQQALRTKAARIVVAEATCSYHHETKEEAEARIAKYEEDHKDDEKNNGFKLV